MLNVHSRPLSVEEIERVAEDFKEDMDREMKRMVRRHDAQGALGVLEAIEYIDKFMFTLKMRAGAQLGLPPRARPIRLPKRGGE